MRDKTANEKKGNKREIKTETKEERKRKPD